MVDEKGREGWSNKSLWYNHRINTLIKYEQYIEASSLVEQAIELYSKQRKFFIRLKGIIKTKLGDLIDAEECYKEVINAKNPDWWLLHEYARLLKLSGKLEESLKYLYEAANRAYKLELSVKLFFDIGIVCIELNRREEAFAHLMLTKYIREKNAWSISQVLDSAIHSCSNIEFISKYSDQKQCVDICKKYWIKQFKVNESHLKNKKLVGKLMVPKKETPFAFIKTNTEGEIFCLKKDLPKGFKDGDQLEFEKIKSVDKKKNSESWKAIKITKLN